MSAAQMARLLKNLGRGSEYAGILKLFRTGVLVGAGYAAIAVAAGYVGYRLGKWGLDKLSDYLQYRGYIAVTGEVV